MARKSQKQIEAEVLADQERINAEAEKRASVMVENVMAKFLAQFASARDAAGPAAVPGTSSGDNSMAKELAHAIVTASATPAKRAAMVTPEDQLKRDTAKQALFALLADNHAKGLMPIYRVTRKTFLGEIMVDPQFRDPVSKQMLQREINWRGVPNQAMAPVQRAGQNDKEQVLIDLGASVHTLYLQMLGAPVLTASHPSPWVTHGKEILRTTPAPSPNPVQFVAPGTDPRRLTAGEGAGGAAETVRILGKSAEPAVVIP